MIAFYIFAGMAVMRRTVFFFAKIARDKFAGALSIRAYKFRTAFAHFSGMIFMLTKFASTRRTPVLRASAILLRYMRFVLAILGSAMFAILE